MWGRASALIGVGGKFRMGSCGVDESRTRNRMQWRGEGLDSFVRRRVNND